MQVFQTKYIREGRPLITCAGPRHVHKSAALVAPGSPGGKSGVIGCLLTPRHDGFGSFSRVRAGLQDNK